jgi:hypothetical protein
MLAAQARAEAVPQPLDPWRLRLERVRGTTGFDGLERISTQTLLDVLGWSSASEPPAHTGTLLP